MNFIFSLYVTHRHKKCKDIVNWLKAMCLKSTDGAKVVTPTFLISKFNIRRLNSTFVKEKNCAIFINHIDRFAYFVASFATTSVNNKT